MHLEEFCVDEKHRDSHILFSHIKMLTHISLNAKENSKNLSLNNNKRVQIAGKSLGRTVLCNRVKY